MPDTPQPPAAPADDAAAAAVRDLATRLGVPHDRASVVRVVAVTWRDGSLGCPRPGMLYSQALVDGLLIELEVDGTTYEYHSGRGRAPFLCEHPEPPLRRTS